MDIASVIGLIVGAAVMVVAILIAPGASFGGFVDYPSMMVVFGGMVAATLICFPLKTFLGMFGVFKKVFFGKTPEVAALIEQLVSLAETARRDGMLALESRLEDVSSPFVVLGIQMAVDGTRPEVIEDVMRSEMEAVATRHRDGKNLLDQMGRYGPAFGMIGTLMGLIIMLGQLSDPDALGPGMAVALITTLYGAVTSNLIFLPAAEKLAFISKKELVGMEIIMRGILAIQSGENPRVIEQKLATFVPPKLRVKAKEAA